MPFQSESQRRLCWVLYNQDIKKGIKPKWDCKEWSKETPSKKLPLHKTPTKSKFSLREYGYKMKDPVRTRHKALKMALGYVDKEIIFHSETLHSVILKRLEFLSKVHSGKDYHSNIMNDIKFLKKIKTEKIK